MSAESLICGVVMVGNYGGGVVQMIKGWRKSYKFNCGDGSASGRFGDDSMCVCDAGMTLK